MARLACEVTSESHSFLKQLCSLKNDDDISSLILKGILKELGLSDSIDYNRLKLRSKNPMTEEEFNMILIQEIRKNLMKADI